MSQSLKPQGAGNEVRAAVLLTAGLAMARLVACYLNAYPQPPVVSPAGGAGTPAVGVPGSIEHPLLCPPAS